MGLINNIKKEAQKNNTKIQTTECADIEKLLNKTFYLPKNIKEETAFVKQVMTRGLESQERVGLHASAMLVSNKDFCVRQQVLSLIYKQSQGHDIQVGLKRIFEEGNCIHEKWQRLFLRANYCDYKQCDFTQFNDEYMISFTPDIIANIPSLFDGEDFIVEIKSVNTFQFKNMTKHPSAWKQCQWYMHLTGLKHGFVLCDDKNTQDFKIEVHHYDSALVAPFVERAEEIVFYYKRVFEEKKMVGRPDDAKTPTCKRCMSCNVKDACWDVGIGKVKIDEGWD